MALKSDQVERRPTARRDPREEPSSTPEPSAPAIPEPERSAVRGVKALVAAAPELAPEPEPPRERESGISPKPLAPLVPRVNTRLVEIEPLLATSSWPEIVKHLGPPEAAAQLPPTLGLIYAVAQREAAGDRSTNSANVLAIRCMAAIYGVQPESATALVLAKRLLRQNPAAWRTKPAPSAKVSVPIIVIGILVGAAVGWYLSLGAARFF